MAKTQEELKELKTEYETLNNKLKELTNEELNMVVGGGHSTYPFSTCLPNNQSWKCPECGNTNINNLKANDSSIRRIKCKDCLYIGFADEFKA